MKTWTDEETRILIENYNTATNSELSKLIPNKSAQAIYKKAYKMGLRKTKEIEFRNRSEVRRGENGANWKGGKRKTRRGYIQVLRPDHPRADSSGYVMEHIIVWEESTGVPVPLNCCIHHLNEKKDDNRIENLCMMETGAHTRFHHIGSSRSDETKKRLSAKAKSRLADKRNHPFYKDVDLQAVQNLINQGMTVAEACKAYGIGKTTYYEKRREQNGS